MHGDAEAALGVGCQEGLREAAGLRAEDEDAGGREGGVPVGAGGLGGEVEPGDGGVEGGPEVRERVPEMDIDLLPVVESGALELAVIDAEPERLDEVEPRARGQAETPHRTGVVGDFWLVEDEVEQGGKGIRDRG